MVDRRATKVGVVVTRATTPLAMHGAFLHEDAAMLGLRSHRRYARAMARDIAVEEFGLAIAYLLPGFTAVWGSALATGIAEWRDLTYDGPTLGGFLSTTVVSLAAGLALSTARWLIVDSLHHATGLRPPQRHFKGLENSVAAYAFLNDAHYRYYQHAAGMMLAIAWVYGLARWTAASPAFGWLDVVAVLLVVLYFLGSRDSLKKFYERTGQLLGSERPSRRGVNRA